jgi:hypothetical protein
MKTKRPVPVLAGGLLCLIQAAYLFYQQYRFNPPGGALGNLYTLGSVFLGVGIGLFVFVKGWRWIVAIICGFSCLIIFARATSILSMGVFSGAKILNILWLCLDFLVHAWVGYSLIRNPKVLDYIKNEHGST